MPVQVINTELVGLLESHFQPRYDSAFAWKSAVSSLLALPNLVAAWPISALRRDSAADRVRDISGGGYHLTEVNSPDYGYDNLAPYVNFNGTNEYIYRVDGGAAEWADVTGTETHVAAAQRGLTLGGWFNFDDLDGFYGLIAKFGAAAGASRAYYLAYDNVTNDVKLLLSNNGAATTHTVVGPSFSGTTWAFHVGRFVPSGNCHVFTNNVSGAAVVGPAALFDADSPLTIGARSDATTNFFDGKASMNFLCACALSDAIIFSLFEQQRALFGA